MSAIVASQRGRVGTILIACGAMLVALAAVMVVGPAPIAQAHGGFPHGAQNCDVSPLQDERATGGFKVGIASNSVPPTGSTNDEENIDGVTWSITDDPLYTVVDSATNSSTGYWFNYSYDGTGGYTLYGYYIKNGASNTGDDHSGFTSTNPGSIEIPSGNSHITLCFDGSVTTTTTTTTVGSTTTTTVGSTTTTTVGSTTTTTVGSTTTTTVGSTTTTTVGSTTTTVGGPGDTTTTTSGNGTTTTTSGNGTTTTTSGNGTTTTTSGGGDTTTTTLGNGTTTTVGGPDDPTTTTTGGGDTTTTTGGTTTSVLGPDDPELPNNGAGQLLAILLGGLGLVFMGSGSLVIASERRRLIR